MTERYISWSGIEADLQESEPCDAVLSDHCSDVADDGCPVVTVGDRQLQLFFTSLEDSANITQSVVESKCLTDMRDNFNVNIPLSRTPLTRLLSENDCKQNYEQVSSCQKKGSCVSSSNVSDVTPNKVTSKERRTPKHQHIATRSSPRIAKKLRGRACYEYVQQVS